MGDGQTVNGQAIAILAVSAAFIVLAVLAVILRFLARTHKGSSYYLDDYLILLGLVFTLGVTINNIVAVSVAGIGEHEDFSTSGPGKGFPFDKELQLQGKVMYALQILHTCAMPVIKASILAFYVRLFPTPRFKIAAYAVSVYVFCWWVSTLFVTVFQCRPISHNWGTDSSQLGSCIRHIDVFYEAAAFLNMAGDLLVLGLPFPVVFGLHMPLKSKIAVLGIFLTGLLVVIAGIGRTVAYFRTDWGQSYDFSYWYYKLVIWTTVEPTVGVISACLPTLRPVFSGLSPGSLASSIRSMFSLHSLRGNSSNRDRTSDYRQHLPCGAAQGSSTIKSRSQGGFSKLPDPNASSKENQNIAMELEERRNMQRQMPAKSIVVQEDLDQKVVHAAREMV